MSSQESYGHVHFEPDTWRMLQEYTDLCPTEVACMGYATLDGPIVKVHEVFLVPQVVSGSSVEFMDTGFPWAVNKALQEGRIDELRFIWHSHCNFSAFFSSIDEDMVRKVRNHGPIPWLADVVLNKKGETHAQIDYFALGDGVNEFCQHLMLPLEVQVGDFPADETEKRIEELEAMLTKKPVTTTTTTSSKSSGVVGKSGCTAADWRLHNQAKSKGWESYVDDEGYIHYWDPKEGGSYKGSAKVPLKSDGTPHDGYYTTTAYDHPGVIECLDGGRIFTDAERQPDFEKMSDEELDAYCDAMIEHAEKREREESEQKGKDDEVDPHVDAIMERGQI